MGNLLLYLILALGVSFLCSLLEAVILSIPVSYVTLAGEQENRTGRYLKQFKEQIDRPLSAILTLNTFAHTIGAAGVGVEAQRLWGNEYLSVTSGVLTILILFLSEIIPKTLGALYWRRLVPFTVHILMWLIYSPIYPFVVLSRMLTNYLKRGPKEKPVSRAELSALAQVGMKSGEFRQVETSVIQNIMKFDFLRTKDIMTPRVVVYSLNADSLLKDFIGKFEQLQFSRIPVYQGDQENITGYVLKDEILVKLLKKEYDISLKEFQRDITIVVNSQSISTLFEKLSQENEMIAMVVDEYGGMDGIVTMEDIVETILGLEIVDESDNVEDMRRLAREKWRQRSRKSGN